MFTHTAPPLIHPYHALMHQPLDVHTERLLNPSNHRRLSRCVFKASQNFVCRQILESHYNHTLFNRTIQQNAPALPEIITRFYSYLLRYNLLPLINIWQRFVWSRDVANSKRNFPLEWWCHEHEHERGTFTGNQQTLPLPTTGFRGDRKNQLRTVQTG